MCFSNFFLKQALRDNLPLKLKFSACAKGLFVDLSSEKITCVSLSTGLRGCFWGMVVAVEVKREEKAKRRHRELQTCRLGREGSGRAASPPQALSERRGVPCPRQAHCVPVPSRRPVTEEDVTRAASAFSKPYSFKMM